MIVDINNYGFNFSAITRPMLKRRDDGYSNNYMYSKIERIEKNGDLCGSKKLRIVDLMSHVTHQNVKK